MKKLHLFLFLCAYISSCTFTMEQNFNYQNHNEEADSDSGNINFNVSDTSDYLVTFLNDKLQELKNLSSIINSTEDPEEKAQLKIKYKEETLTFDDALNRYMNIQKRNR